MANTLMEMYYVGLLSGPTTQYRSIAGALLSSIPNIAASIINPKNTKIVFGNNAQGLKMIFKFLDKNSYNQILLDGISTIDLLDTVEQKDRRVSRAINKVIKNPRAQFKKALSEKGFKAVKEWGKIFYTGPTMMTRLLIATDAFLKHGIKEYEAYIAKAHELIEGGDTINAEFWTKLNKQLAIDQDSTAEIAQQASEDVDDAIAKGFMEGVNREGAIKRRMSEIRDSIRGDEVSEISERNAQRMLLTNAPETGLANAYKLFMDKTQVKPGDSFGVAMAKFFFRSMQPIVKVPTNMAIMGWSFTPLGALFNAYTIDKSGVKKRTKIRTPLGKEKYRTITPEEWSRGLAKGAIGLTTQIMLTLMMFDWDEEEGLVFAKYPLMRLHGNIDKKRFEEMQQVFPDAEPMTLQWLMPKYWFMSDEELSKVPQDKLYSRRYFYGDNPLGMVIAPLAEYSDMKRFKQFKKEVANPGRQIVEDSHVMEMITAYSFSTAQLDFQMSQSYSQGIKNFYDLFMGSERLKAKTARKTITNPIRTTLWPNIYAQTNKEINAIIGNYDKQYQDNVWPGMAEQMIQDVPGIQSAIMNDKHDVFGYPIPDRSNFVGAGVTVLEPLFPTAVAEKMSTYKDYRRGKREWKLLWKFPEVTVGTFEPMLEKSGGVPIQIDEKVYYEPMTGQDRLDWKRKASETFGEMVREDIKALEQIEDPVELQRVLKIMKANATQIANFEIKENLTKRVAKK